MEKVLRSLIMFFVLLVEILIGISVFANGLYPAMSDLTIEAFFIGWLALNIIALAYLLFN